MEDIGTFGQTRYTIRDLHLFQDASEPEVAAALAGCAVVRVRAGCEVEDNFRARLYIILSGSLSVSSDAPSGSPDSWASRLLPGESVGEQSVLDEVVNRAAITALEDSELLVIEPDLVWQLIDQSSALARNLLRLLSFRIRAANALLRRRQKLEEFYRQMSLNDALTGLYNRAWLADMLPRLVARAQHEDRPLSIVMIDLDHFKKFNDTHGHQAGDAALCAAAGLIREALRPTDYAVRYGGEEMMAVLPGTSEKLALMVAERLCQRMRETVVFDDMRLPLPHITGSFGVAARKPGADANALIAAADAALYRAKDGGRNRICV